MSRFIIFGILLSLFWDKYHFFNAWYRLYKILYHRVIPTTSIIIHCWRSYYFINVWYHYFSIWYHLMIPIIIGIISLRFCIIYSLFSLILYFFYIFTSIFSIDCIIFNNIIYIIYLFYCIIFYSQIFTFQYCVKYTRRQ